MEATGRASLIDDAAFSRTREYTSTIELLRLLHNDLIKIIDSWESFDRGEIQYFDIRDQESLRKRWESYLANIEKDISELRFLRRSLHQRIESLDSKRNGVSSQLSWVACLSNLSSWSMLQLWSRVVWLLCKETTLVGSPGSQW